MWHATCTQVNQSNSWLLMFRNQIANLTPGPSFGHNLCSKYPNGSCKPILDIYVPRFFQWHKELFNPMSFGPCNCPLKIWKSIRTLTSKMGAHLGSVGVHSLALSCTHGSMKCDSSLHFWPTPLQALALVASPRLRLQHNFSKCTCGMILYKVFTPLWNIIF
jgi:hypothetical protein